MSEESCEACRFWVGLVLNGEDSGRCHRHAPRPQAVPMRPFDLWPETYDFDWCGEFQAKPPRVREFPIEGPVALEQTTLRCAACGTAQSVSRKLRAESADVRSYFYRQGWTVGDDAAADRCPDCRRAQA